MSNAFRNERGSLNVVIICMVVLMASIYFVMDTVQSSRTQAERLTDTEGKIRIISQMQAMLRSEYVVNYSLGTYNNCTSNPALHACVLTGDPNVTRLCDAVNVDFYIPQDTGGKKFAGGPTSPAYFDPQGEDCVDESGNPTNRCRFKVVADCRFRCPGSQGTCALVKTMACDLEISYYAGRFAFRTFRSSEHTTLPTVTYALRLNNDLESMYVLK